ncbi:RDD family protein [Halobacillus sp. K22]|uniref:RDD family protein n=1 Tax=Halobacillus sp. K22 TaxID=3457431 RepID=UPI003FCC3E0A
MERSAGFGVRFLANLVDSLIIGLLFGTITYFSFGEFYKEDANFTDFLSLLYLLITPVIWKGYIIGKRIFNIRIVKTSGQNVTLLTMVMRVIVGGLIYALTFGIALIVSGIMVLAREDNRSIHDFIAGTYVKHEN